MNVTSFTSNDAAFHFLVGQCHSGNGRFGYVIGGASLNCQRQQIACLTVGFFLELCLELVQLLSHIVSGFRFHTRNKLSLGFLGGIAGDLFETGQMLCQNHLNLFLDNVVCLQLFVQLFCFAFQCFGLFVKIFFFLHQTALLTGNFSATLFEITLGLVTQAKHFFLTLKEKLFLLGLSVLVSFFHDAFCFLLSRTDLLLTDVLSDEEADTASNDNRGSNRDNQNP